MPSNYIICHKHNNFIYNTAAKTFFCPFSPDQNQWKFINKYLSIWKKKIMLSLNLRALREGWKTIHHGAAHDTPGHHYIDRLIDRKIDR